MDAEKFELLETQIRETVMLVSRLREEKQQLEWENEHLRARVAELETQLTTAAGAAAQRYEPEIDHLLAQLDTLQQGEEASVHPAPALQTAFPTPPPHLAPTEAPSVDVASEALARDLPPRDDLVQRGMQHEQQGEYEPAIDAYQRALELDGDNLEVAQRLAFLLEKLNRDAEAAAVWDKIWALRDAQAPTRRRRLR